MITYPNAKINLGLNILRKRPDGFHAITSVFIPVMWRDILEIIEDDGATKGTVTFTSSGIAVPDDGKPNLCERAYALLHERHGLPAVKMHLHKLIPIGAGLGGGSADAAFALRMLNEQFALGETDANLEDLAAQLGSDCPFFIRNTPQFVAGRGERMEAIPLEISGLYLLVVCPNIHVSTAEAYANVVPDAPRFPLHQVMTWPVEKWKDALQNDFEDSVFPKYPLLAEVKEKLYAAGAVYASMTGSGSALYGLYREPVEVKLPEGMNFRWMKI